MGISLCERIIMQGFILVIRHFVNHKEHSAAKPQSNGAAAPVSKKNFAKKTKCCKLGLRQLF